MSFGHRGSGRVPGIRRRRFPLTISILMALGLKGQIEGADERRRGYWDNSANKFAAPVLEPDGTTVYMALLNSEKLTDKDLAKILFLDPDTKIGAWKEMLFFIGSCSSGGFIAELATIDGKESRLGVEENLRTKLGVVTASKYNKYGWSHFYPGIVKAFDAPIATDLKTVLEAFKEACIKYGATGHLSQHEPQYWSNGVDNVRPLARADFRNFAFIVVNPRDKDGDEEQHFWTNLKSLHAVLKGKYDWVDRFPDKNRHLMGEMFILFADGKPPASEKDDVDWIDGEATKARFIEVLKVAQSGITGTSNVCFFLEGHGGQTPPSPRGGEEVVDACSVIDCNGNWIPDEFEPDRCLICDPAGSCSSGRKAFPCSQRSALCVQVLASLDPNEKAGPRGIGEARHLSGGAPGTYVIDFENKETATAAAQEVVIEDPLDPGKLDLDTFSLGPISFGRRSVTPPPGQAVYLADVDLRPEKDLIVRIDARLEAVAGRAVWRFSSVDPATGLPTEDPLAGFLPPNHTSPEGEGNVTYSIRPLASLPTGTEIGSAASIVFDANPPILTNTWLNTIDRTEPESEVEPLEATLGFEEFLVGWQGQDAESGLDAFTILVSEDGGPYATWLGDTRDPYAVFHGEAGKTYSFYSIARDLAGNVEEAPATADATTTVRAGSKFRRGDSNGDAEVDLSDAIFIFSWLFIEGRDPACLDAADSNDDRMIDISDPIQLLGWIFLGGSEPPPPGPFECGGDSTEDPLGPCSYDSCGGGPIPR